MKELITILVGYIRVSKKTQKLDRQLEQLIEYGVDKRNIYQEKMTGTRSDRPELNRMINELQEGDIVIIADLTRVSRSTKDLLMIVDKIKSKGANIRSIKDEWLNTTSENPYNQFLLTIFSSLSQLERDLIRSRTMEGLEVAKAKGRKGGRPSKINQKADVVKMLYEKKYKISEIVEKTGLGRTSVYRIINQIAKENAKTKIQDTTEKD